ncbi:TetR family transcriptional regulator C-terminal domain-containing protein [Glutamicibacter sp. FBE19]|uniref:TetR/AcrR family transcriptional regulator n=1 Tax=Glutamicibacter sp. FBE19 TaxID=2761534 RepID=UPI00189665FA|nr:TetR family transcriptional regulator C-terminal domain-containing protein [Glutamicibacter sp. FBE19]MBF6672917.1 TetR family transcriptional regulator C-terminal domain-containing protein [Glutamicibacter sp. FBE19]
MPKIVDHDQRRREIVEVTWKFIAREGIEKLNLRDLAAAAGYANGALKPYFPTRDALLVATFNFVADATNQRIKQNAAGMQGLEAIAAFAREVLPLDELRRNEARIAVHFWHLALGDPKLAVVNASTMDQWRSMLDGWLEQIFPAADARTLMARDALINFLLGAQASSVLDAEVNTAVLLEEQLKYQLDLLDSFAR